MENQTIQFQNKEVNGYIKIKVDDWIFEDKYIVENFINRKLTKQERIHHIDSNPKNNNINNLVIFPDNQSHVLFHTKVNQFGMTRPRLKELNELKLNMIKEKIKNKCVHQ